MSFYPIGFYFMSHSQSKKQMILLILFQNVLNLSYKQSYAKFLDEVKKGKYRLLIKNELKMSEELATEWKKNSDLISIVEALKNDFPDLDFHITRLLCILKSINS